MTNPRRIRPPATPDVLEERLDNLAETMKSEISEAKEHLSQEIQAVAETVRAQNGRIGKVEKWQLDQEIEKAKKQGFREGQTATFSKLDKWSVRVIAIAGSIGSAVAVWKELL